MTVYLDDLTRLVRTKTIECECGCWYWTGSCDSSGYAKFKLRGKTLILHRYSYERLVGDIPDEMTVDHLNCTSRKCINPEHMQLVTRAINAERANGTRWHDVKFDADGSERPRANCPHCKQRDDTTRLEMGFGSTRQLPEPWYDSDAVDQSV